MKKQAVFRRADLLLIAIVAAACLFLLWPSGEAEGVQAVLYSGGREVRRIYLAEVGEPYTLTLGDAPQGAVLVEQGRIRYLSADCPDALCVKSGWLSKPGDTAACLPARTVISIEGGRERSGVDVQTY